MYVLIRVLRVVCWSYFTQLSLLRIMLIRYHKSKLDISLRLCISVKNCVNVSV